MSSRGSAPDRGLYQGHQAQPQHRLSRTGGTRSGEGRGPRRRGRPKSGVRRRPAPGIAVLVMPAVQQVLRLAQMNRSPD